MCHHARHPDADRAATVVGFLTPVLLSVVDAVEGKTAEELRQTPQDSLPPILRLGRGDRSVMVVKTVGLFPSSPRNLSDKHDRQRQIKIFLSLHNSNDLPIQIQCKANTIHIPLYHIPPQQNQLQDVYWNKYTSWYHSTQHNRKRIQI